MDEDKKIPPKKDQFTQCWLKAYMNRIHIQFPLAAILCKTNFAMLREHYPITMRFSSYTSPKK